MGVSVSVLGHDLTAMKHRGKVWNLELGHENRSVAGRHANRFPVSRKKLKISTNSSTWMDILIENYGEASDSSRISVELDKEQNFAEKESSFGAGQSKSDKFKLKTYKPQAEIFQFFGPKQQNASQSVEVMSIESSVSETVVPKKAAGSKRWIDWKKVGDKERRRARE